MFVKGSESLNLRVLLTLFTEVSLLWLFIETFRGKVGSSSIFEDWGGDIRPGLQALKFFTLGNGEVFCKLHEIGLLINFEETLGWDSGRSKNTSELCSEEVALLSWEHGVAVKVSVEFSSHNVLNLARGFDVFRFAVGQLNPIVEQIFGDPEYKLVDTCTTLFNLSIDIVLLRFHKHTRNNPVVLVGSHDLSCKSDSISSTHNSESLRSLN
jgi:hypothetical protein